MSQFIRLRTSRLSAEHRTGVYVRCTYSCWYKLIIIQSELKSYGTYTRRDTPRKHLHKETYTRRDRRRRQTHKRHTHGRHIYAYENDGFYSWISSLPRARQHIACSIAERERERELRPSMRSLLVWLYSRSDRWDLLQPLYMKSPISNCESMKRLVNMYQSWERLWVNCRTHFMNAVISLRGRDIDILGLF